MNIGKFLKNFLKDDVKDIDIRSFFEEGKKKYKINYVTRDDNVHQITLFRNKVDLLSEFFTCLESKIYYKTIVNVTDSELGDEKKRTITTLDNMNILLLCVDGSTDFNVFNKYIDNKRRSDCYIRYIEIISLGNVKKLIIQEDKESNKINFIKLDEKYSNVNYHISSDNLDDEGEIEKILGMINNFILVNGSVSSIDDKCYTPSDICVSKTINLQNDDFKIIIKGVRLIEALKGEIDNLEPKKLEMESE